MDPLGAVWLCAVSQSLSCIPRALRAVSKSFVSQSLSCIPRAFRAVSKSFVSQSLSHTAEKMQSVWLCVISSEPFEEAFDNTPL